MRLLIDFGAIKTGGAVQLGTNFLRFFDNYPEDIEAIFLLLPELGPLSRITDTDRYDGYLTYPESYAKRKLFEMTKLRRFVADNKIDTFFTFLGSGIPTPPGVRSVVSLAYPTICYPDSPYWGEVPLPLKLKARIVHKLRKNRINSADHVLVETEVMAKRIKQYIGVKPHKISVIPPSPSLFLADVDYRIKPANRTVKFLVLSAIYIHKNLRLLPRMAQELKTRGMTDFQFILSVKKEEFTHTYHKDYELHRSVVDQHFRFTGPIAADDIESIYRESDFLVNISDLESFSNNYMEAWKSGMPLICSDTDFARHICSDSAIYVDPRNPGQAAQAIVTLVDDQHRQQAMALAGKTLLGKLPTLEQRFDLVIDKIRSISLNGALDSSSRLPETQP